MITKEQIKNLKHGDPVIVHGTFEGATGDGDIRVKIPMIFYSNVASNYIKYVPSSEVSIDESAYDHARLFRKGDKVRVVEWNGRKDHLYGMEAIVLSDEYGCLVDIECKIKDVKAELTYPACLLELIIPVEELKPYEVTESSDYYGVDKDDLEVEAAIFWKKSHPNAKAAAEAECNRLNAEYRKEQNND